MKRIFKLMLLLFVLVLSFSLIGCSSTASTSKEKQEPKKAKMTKTVKIKSEKISNSSKESTVSVTEKKNAVSKTTLEANKQTKSASKQVVAVQMKTATSSNSKTVTASSAKTTTVKSNQVPIKTVTFSITGPKNHRGILAASKVDINDGETILDVLLHATKTADIQVDYDGFGATAYVNGIDNIYEFDYGAKSGWLFKQNGVSLTKSVGLVKIKAGDRIECYYTE